MRFSVSCVWIETRTSCIGRKRQKGYGDDSTKWTIRRRRLTGFAMFTIAHVLRVLHIEDYNELSFLMLAICPTLLHISLSLSFSLCLSPSLLLLLMLLFYTYRVFLLYSSILHLTFDYRPLIKLAGLALHFLSFLHPFRPEDRRHSFDPSWYNESVLPVRRSSTENVKVKCDSDSSWCHDAGVQQNWLFLSCRAIPGSSQSRRSNDIRLSPCEYYGSRKQKSNVCTCHLQSDSSFIRNDGFNNWTSRRWRNNCSVSFCSHRVTSMSIILHVYKLKFKRLYLTWHEYVIKSRVTYKFTCSMVMINYYSPGA